MTTSLIQVNDPWRDIRNFGGNLNGSDDDSAALKAAMENSRMSGRGVYIWIPSGKTMVLNSTTPLVTDVGDVTIFAHGANIIGGSNLANDYMITFWKSDLATRSNLQIIGGNVDLNGAKGFLRVSTMSEIIIEDLKVEDSLGDMTIDAMNFDNCAHVLLTRCVFNSAYEYGNENQYSSKALTIKNHTTPNNGFVSPYAVSIRDCNFSGFKDQIFVDQTNSTIPARGISINHARMLNAVGTNINVYNGELQCAELRHVLAENAYRFLRIDGMTNGNSNIKINQCSIKDVEYAFDLPGSGEIITELLRFQASSSKYVFKVNNFSFINVVPLIFDDSYYTLSPYSSSLGQIYNLVRKSKKHTWNPHEIYAWEENVQFSDGNHTTGNTTTLTLPSYAKKGARFLFVKDPDNNGWLKIQPAHDDNHTHIIHGLTSQANRGIKTVTPGASVMLIAGEYENGTMHWYARKFTPNCSIPFVPLSGDWREYTAYV